MNRLPQRLALTVAALTLSSNALAYVADGYLNDWLNSAQLTGSSDVKSGVGIFANDNGNPSGLGGQAYDTEYLMADVDWTTNTLHVAVVTGMRPDYGGTDYPDGSAGWRPGDQRVFVSDIRKIGDELGWSPKTGVREGVGRLFEWIRDHRSLFDHI